MRSGAVRTVFGSWRRKSAIVELGQVVSPAVTDEDGLPFFWGRGCTSSAVGCRLAIMISTISHSAQLAVVTLALLGCSAQEHAQRVQEAGAAPNQLTVGRVQSEIAKGMTGGQVAEVLGSPNIVSTDELGREVWIYDRMATEAVYSESRGGVWVILGVVQGSSGAASKSQRTLTIVIKFDETKRVRDVAYHSSRF